ncbi:hypothetical protein BOTBODRAFT_37273 [Botryobasidium botryosum FD-172 SS1]|uniref:Uncharacterized protein n=1 Tax=Botryobasidium botryosum (strain FD-172 SS1) TaxID=930990 RepID=A0A067M0C4_BOTB1|nr:hypothetical protein BOTBODRAFT_37273 [Botryobasidium botryosum FD-172 SS1]
MFALHCLLLAFPLLAIAITPGIYQLKSPVGYAFLPDRFSRGVFVGESGGTPGEWHVQPSGNLSSVTISSTAKPKWYLCPDGDSLNATTHVDISLTPYDWDLELVAPNDTYQIFPAGWTNVTVGISPKPERTILVPTEDAGNWTFVPIA